MARSGTTPGTARRPAGTPGEAGAGPAHLWYEQGVSLVIGRVIVSVIGTGLLLPVLLTDRWYAAWLLRPGRPRQAMRRGDQWAVVACTAGGTVATIEGLVADPAMLFAAAALFSIAILLGASVWRRDRAVR